MLRNDPFLDRSHQRLHSLKPRPEPSGSREHQPVSACPIVRHNGQHSLASLRGSNAESGQMHPECVNQLGRFAHQQLPLTVLQQLALLFGRLNSAPLPTTWMREAGVVIRYTIGSKWAATQRSRSLNGHLRTLLGTFYV